VIKISNIINTLELAAQLRNTESVRCFESVAGRSRSSSFSSHSASGSPNMLRKILTVPGPHNGTHSLKVSGNVWAFFTTCTGYRYHLYGSILEEDLIRNYHMRRYSRWRSYFYSIFGCYTRKLLYLLLGKWRRLYIGVRNFYAYFNKKLFHSTW
jgi:hypothetical protein